MTSKRCGRERSDPTRWGLRVLALCGAAAGIVLLVASFQAPFVAADVTTPDSTKPGANRPVANLLPSFGPRDSAAGNHRFSGTAFAQNPASNGGPVGVNVAQSLDRGPVSIGSAQSKGRERAVFVALGVLVCLVLIVAIAGGAAGRLQAIGNSDIGEFLTQSWVTSVLAFAIGACAAAAVYALDIAGTQAVFAALAAALVAAVFAAAGAVIRPGHEEETTTLRWLGAMTSGLIAAFLVVSLLAASALALDPSLASTFAGWVAEFDGERFQQTAFEEEAERLVLAMVAGTLFAALTVLLLRGVADSKRAASERRQLQQELQHLRELIEGQAHGKEGPPE